MRIITYYYANNIFQKPDNYNAQFTIFAHGATKNWASHYDVRNNLIGFPLAKYDSNVWNVCQLTCPFDTDCQFYTEAGKLSQPFAAVLHKATRRPAAASIVEMINDYCDKAMT